MIELNIGHLIVDEIIKQDMIGIEILEDGSVLFVWAGNAAEQLEALVEEEIERRMNGTE